MTKAADDVAAADVTDGVGGLGHHRRTASSTESADGGPQHTVAVPITSGCRMAITSALQEHR